MAEGLLVSCQRSLTACTGFPFDVLRLYCEEYNLVNNEGRDLVSALTLMHTDCSNEQLSVFYFALFYESSIDAL